MAPGIIVAHRTGRDDRCEVPRLPHVVLNVISSDDTGHRPRDGIARILLGVRGWASAQALLNETRHMLPEHTSHATSGWTCEQETAAAVGVALPVPAGAQVVLGLCHTCSASTYLPLVAPDDGESSDVHRASFGTDLPRLAAEPALAAAGSPVAQEMSVRGMTQELALDEPGQPHVQRIGERVLTRCQLEGVHLALQTLQDGLINTLSAVSLHIELLLADPALPEPARVRALRALSSTHRGADLIHGLTGLREIVVTDTGDLIPARIDIEHSKYRPNASRLVARQLGSSHDARRA